MDQFDNKKALLGLFAIGSLFLIVVVTSAVFLVERGMNTSDSQAATRLLPTPIPQVVGVKLVPSSGTVASNVDTNINIVADLGMVQSSSMAVRLNLTNLKITNFVVNPNSGKYLFIGTCSGATGPGNYTNDKSICFDMASNAGPIRSGDVIASVTVRANVPNTRNIPPMNISTGAGHMYLRNGNSVNPTSVPTVLGKYTLKNPPMTQVPVRR